jgi:hypothetical protein
MENMKHKDGFNDGGFSLWLVRSYGVIETAKNGLSAIIYFENKKNYYKRIWLTSPLTA